jgi:hypothetical protein
MGQHQKSIEKQLETLRSKSAKDAGGELLSCSQPEIAIEPITALLLLGDYTPMCIVACGCPRVCDMRQPEISGKDPATRRT